MAPHIGVVYLVIEAQSETPASIRPPEFYREDYDFLTSLLINDASHKFAMIQADANLLAVLRGTNEVRGTKLWAPIS